MQFNGVHLFLNMKQFLLQQILRVNTLLVTNSFYKCLYINTNCNGHLNRVVKYININIVIKKTKTKYYNML